MGSYGRGGSKGSYEQETSYSNRQFTSHTSPLKQIISLIEEVGRRADKVALKEQELSNARRELDAKKIELDRVLANLDPRTKELLSSLTQSFNIDGKRR